MLAENVCMDADTERLSEKIDWVTDQGNVL